MGVGGQRHAPSLYSRERPGIHCMGGWVGPRGRSGRVRKISPTPWFDPRTVQPVASRYTGWAIAVPSFTYFNYSVLLLDLHILWCVLLDLHILWCVCFVGFTSFTLSYFSCRLEYGGNKQPVDCTPLLACNTFIKYTRRWNATKGQSE
jgi:hypothetical protein